MIKTDARYTVYINKVYRNYVNKCNEDKWMKEVVLNLPFPNKSYGLFSHEEFINKCKTDSEFSERWGLKIEERELSESELWDYIHKNKIEILHQHAVLYGHEVGSEYRKSFIPTLKENYNIPTKLITVTYQGKTVESYE
jgi:hypothetical protein